jgi:serine/threonine-protein kinase
MEEVPSYDALTLEGAIIGQLPVSETLVEAGSTVSVLVSLGPPGTLLPTPRVMGLSEVDAIAVLQRAGFMPLPSYAQTTFGRTGEVVAQTPATGSLTYPGAPVQFLVSTNIAGADSTVPDVVGMREENALLVLEEAGFAYTLHPYVDSQVTTGTIVAQMPLPADMQIRAGEAVELLVARGTDIRAVVPGVLGSNVSAARETLREYGFRPITVPLPAAVAEGDVYQQFPSEGSDYYIGLPVLLFAGRPVR